jgi:hypothetical protein
MADVAVPADQPFSLVFVVFTTFFFLLTQEDQVRCFANVAERLAPGGRFVLECLMPDPARYTRGQDVEAHRLEVDHVRLMLARHSAVTQRVDLQGCDELDPGGSPRRLGIRARAPAQWTMVWPSWPRRGRLRRCCGRSRPRASGGAG